MANKYRVEKNLDPAVKFGNGYECTWGEKKLTYLENRFRIWATAQLSEMGTATVELNYMEIAKVLDFKRWDMWYMERFLEACGKKFSMWHFDGNGPVSKLFNVFEMDGKKGVLRIAAGEKLVPMLNGLTKNFTLFPFSEFRKLRTAKGQALYLHVMRWMNNGSFTFWNFTTLKETMDISRKLPDNRVRTECIIPAAAEVNRVCPGLDIRHEMLSDKYTGRPFGVRLYWNRKHFSKKGPGKGAGKKAEKAPARQETKTPYVSFGGESLSEEDFKKLSIIYGGSKVRRIIARILEKGYRNCLNITVIEKWLEEKLPGHLKTGLIFGDITGPGGVLSPACAAGRMPSVPWYVTERECP